MSNKKAREEVVDYIYNHYELGEKTMVITNSDMGKGYTPYVFKELVGGFSGKHLHFWDRYHLNERIKDFFKSYPPTLQERFFQAIATHNKQEARLVLETIESIVETEEEMIRFEQFSMILCIPNHLKPMVFLVMELGLWSHSNQRLPIV